MSWECHKLTSVIFVTMRKGRHVFHHRSEAGRPVQLNLFLPLFGGCLSVFYIALAVSIPSSFAASGLSHVFFCIVYVVIVVNSSFPFIFVILLKLIIPVTTYWFATANSFVSCLESQKTCPCCSHPNVGNIVLRISDFVDLCNRDQDSLIPHIASTEVAMNLNQDRLISHA